MAKILLIEDDPNLREIIAFNLKRKGYEVIDTDNANEALIYLDESLCDVILLDLMLPGLKGEDFLKIIHTKNGKGNIPVIVISAKNSEDKIVEMLDAGAYDYLTKPFSIKILISKIDNILKQKSTATNSYSYKDIEIDIDIYGVLIDKKEINLTNTEFKLLLFFVKHPKMVFSRSQLLSNVWGYDSDIYTRTVDAHISSLRKKIKNSSASIISVPKIGYKIQ